MHFIEDVLSNGAGHSHHHHHHNHPARDSDVAAHTSLLGQVAPASYNTAKPAADAKAAVEAPCAPDHHHHHATTTACETDEVRIVSSNKFVNLVLVEFGFSIHSVFVGLAVATADEEDFPGLLVAICFHQFFEGIAISAKLVASGLGWQRDAIFGAIFSLSAPLGIVLGLFAAAASESLNSSTFLISQGVLDCIAAGIMLYIGFSMLLIDFPVDVAALCDHVAAGADKQRTATIMRASMFGAVWVGMIGMALLGKYL
jgi:zinc transporter 1/2/3